MSANSKPAPTLIHIDVPVWDFGVTVILDPKHWSNGDVKKIFKKNNPSTYNDKGYEEFLKDSEDTEFLAGMFLYSDDLPSQYVIYIPQWRNSAQCYSTFNHEVFHLAHRSLSYRGLSLTDSSEEAYAYLTSHVSREFYTELWK